MMDLRTALSPFVLPGERGPARRQACRAFPENPMKSTTKQQSKKVLFCFPGAPDLELLPIPRLGRPPGKTPPKTAKERMQAMRDRRKGKNEKPSIEMTTK